MASAVKVRPESAAPPARGELAARLNPQQVVSLLDAEGEVLWTGPVQSVDGNKCTLDSSLALNADAPPLEAASASARMMLGTSCLSRQQTSSCQF